MVILKRLYTETGLFDEVRFGMGINLVKGIYTKSQEEHSELNGIGKSTLVRLIDFALLSSEGQILFDVKTHSFLKGHSITLEFQDDDITYYIRRDFAEPRKAHYGKSLDSMEEYSVEDLRVVLGNIFFAKDDYRGVFENNWFRNLIRFFIKDDINHHERKDPLKFISAHKSNFETYVYNLFLLGLPNKAVNEFSVLKQNIDDLIKMKTRVNRRIKEETGKKIGELSSEISILDRKIAVFQESLEKYEFLSSYEGIEKELISISSQISQLLSQLTPIERRLSDYRKSYDYEIEIDTRKIAKLYSEVKIVFGDAVKKQFDDVISFRKKLSENRKRFLANKEIELSGRVEQLKMQISEFEKKRSALYKMLDEKKALDGIKNTYQLMIEEKAKKDKLVSSIASVRKIEEELIIQNKLRSEAVSQIAGELNAAQDQLESIRSIFLDIVSQTIHVGSAEEAVFDIRPAADMKSPVKIDIEIPKSLALGKQRFKVLIYDLTVFFNLIADERTLPHFLVHDGVFHGIDIKTVVKVLNLVNSMFLQNPNFQYIITANEKELEIPENKKKVYGEYTFDLDEATIATYKDIPGEMIFKREYA
ncbi:MAG: DUF2326 domain-containing protein [Thermodesulfovibrionales bacterium]